ncbi:hypothetical protein QF025_006872 [Paraburkholderia graminis]|uniref:Uncharacterized protein n=1 Tax=Paraburkholderia graminis TaxID=60548 RepID=A0ABD5CSK3_9BURK|nr:hypothetical protein [Paraburkholderia graminis]
MHPSYFQPRYRLSVGALTQQPPRRLVDERMLWAFSVPRDRPLWHAPVAMHYHAGLWTTSEPCHAERVRDPPPPAG